MSLANVEEDEIVIRVKISAIPDAVRASAELHRWGDIPEVTKPHRFALDMVYALNSEDYAGETLVNQMLDAAVLGAVESGSEGLDWDSVPLES